MKNIKYNHYIDSIIYSIDKIIRSVKYDLNQKVDSLNLGITSEQFFILDTINSFDDIYLQKLSEVIMKDKSNITRILKVLESKRLLEREMGNINNRLVYLLRVTDKGKDLIERSTPKIKKYLLETFKNITDEDVEMLRTISKKFE